MAACGVLAMADFFFPSQQDHHSGGMFSLAFPMERFGTGGGRNPID